MGTGWGWGGGAPMHDEQKLPDTRREKKQGGVHPGGRSTPGKENFDPPVLTPHLSQNPCPPMITVLLLLQLFPTLLFAGAVLEFSTTALQN